MKTARPRVEVGLDKADMVLTTTKAAGTPDGLLSFFGRALTCGMTSSDSFSFPAVAPTTSEYNADDADNRYRMLCCHALDFSCSLLF